MPGITLGRSTWDSSPLKRRRVTIEDLELDFKQLSLSGDAWKKVELDTLLQTLTLNTSPELSESDCGPSLPRDAYSNVRKADLNPDKEMHGMAEEDHNVESSRSHCTAIVPFVGKRRWRRIPRDLPRILAVPRPIAKFAVDSDGTAFVLPETVRAELSRTRDTWKRTYVCREERDAIATTAIVIYQKPRKHDLVEDFMSLKL